MALPNHDATRHERNRRMFRRLADQPALPLRIEDVEAKIQGYEEKYRLLSEEMVKLVKTGEMPETLEVCDWLMALDLLELMNDPSI